jgi:HK97 family phage prohead protease
VKRAAVTNIERRIVTSKVELRGEGEQKRLQGYAAVFNEETVIGGGWWGFREKIDPGAFTDAITADDVRALFNHDPNYVLGRNTSGTLTLKEDDHGLHYDIDPPATQVGRDVVTLVSRGDISQSSFAFIVPEDGDDWNYDEVKVGKLPLRTIRKVQLMDVSPVTYPAYPSTSVSARAKEMGAVGRPDRRGDDEDGELPEATSAAFTAAHRAIEAAHAACRSLQEQVDISDAEDYGDNGSNNAGAADADANSARRPTTTRTSGKPTMSNAGAHAVRACRRSLDAARHAMRCAMRDAKHAADAGDGNDGGDTGSDGGGDAGANAAALTDLQLRERELELDEVL